MSKSIVNKYIEQLYEKLEKESENFFYAFRGQPDFEYVLDCSAARSFDEGEKNRNSLKDNQSKLIGDLKIRGFGFSKEKQKYLSDLELLADLRHYGAPSCLFDFTSNFLIALWFACYSPDSKKKEDGSKKGKVFILNCYETDRFSLVSSGKIKKDIEYFFDKKFERLWYWVPERLNQRLTDQDAVFVFGEPEITDYECIEVEATDKEKILDELERFFDYSHKTLFSDKYALGEIYRESSKGEKLWEYSLEDAVYYIQTGNFAKAKERLGKMKNYKDLESQNKQLFWEVNFQIAFAEIEDIKMKLKKLVESPNKKEETIDLAKSHIKALESGDGEGMTYIKDFKDCISNGHKKEKIERIKEGFKNILLSFLPPEKE